MTTMTIDLVYNKLTRQFTAVTDYTTVRAPLHNLVVGGTERRHGKRFSGSDQQRHNVVVGDVLSRLLRRRLVTLE